MKRSDPIAARVATRRAPARGAFFRFALLLAVLLPAAAGAALYAPDPAYNAGLIGPDAFAGNVDRSYEGRKIVRLANGDVVVAGLVPKFESGTALINLGLVRYDSSGVRVAWSNPTAGFAFHGNQYLIYPNRGLGDTSIGHDLVINDVKDIKAYGNRLFVLADGYFQNFGGPLVKVSRVLIFGTDGTFFRSAVVGPAGTLAGGIVVYDNGILPTTVSLAFGGYTDPALGISEPVYARYTVAADSSLSETALVNPVPAYVCNSDCEIHGVALGGALSAPRIYLAGTRRQTGNDWDYLVLALTPGGTPINTFGEGGSESIAFDSGGSLFDRANTVVVDRNLGIDEIYLVGDVTRRCKTGAGIAKLTQDGVLDTTFGAPGEDGARSGKRIIGGSGNSPCLLGLPDTTALDAALADGRLAIAGQQSAPCAFIGSGCENNVDGMAIVLAADPGNVGDVVSFDHYPYTDTVGGARTRHSSFSGIVASGNGSFTVAGIARYFQSAPGAPQGAMQYAALRIKPTLTVFSDGFESD